MLQIILTIFEDSSLADKLIEIDYPTTNCAIGDNERNLVKGAHLNKRTSVTEGFLVTVAVVTNVLYERHSAHRNSDVTASDPESDETVSVKALRNEDYTEMLLLCLNVIGAGVSYLPRDLGSALRSVIGAERTKLLHTCCCILRDNDAKKLAYMAKKVEDRKRHQEGLARDQEKEELTMDHSRQHRQTSGSSSDVEPHGSASICVNSMDENSSINEKGSGNREKPYQLTLEEERDGELVKAALQVIGNLAYGCSSVQVFYCLDYCNTTDLLHTNISSMH